MKLIKKQQKERQDIYALIAVLRQEQVWYNLGEKQMFGLQVLACDRSTDRNKNK